MLKGICRDEQGEIAVFGLSKNNIDRLQDDQPIVCELRYGNRRLRVLLFAGSTEEIMETQIHSAGWPFVKQREMPQLSKVDAENLVMLIERSELNQRVAEQLRHDWGMGPRA